MKLWLKGKLKKNTIVEDVDVTVEEIDNIIEMKIGNAEMQIGLLMTSHAYLMFVEQLAKELKSDKLEENLDIVDPWEYIEDILNQPLHKLTPQRRLIVYTYLKGYDKGISDIIRDLQEEGDENNG